MDNKMFLDKFFSSLGLEKVSSNIYRLHSPRMMFNVSFLTFKTKTSISINISLIENSIGALQEMVRVFGVGCFSDKYSLGDGVQDFRYSFICNDLRELKKALDKIRVFVVRHKVFLRRTQKY